MALFKQYDSKVLPFLFTDALFQDTCLLLRSPVRTMVVCSEKMASRSDGAMAAAAGWYAETKSSCLLFCSWRQIAVASSLDRGGRGKES